MGLPKSYTPAQLVIGVLSSLVVTGIVAWFTVGSGMRDAISTMKLNQALSQQKLEANHELMKQTQSFQEERLAKLEEIAEGLVSSQADFRVAVQKLTDHVEQAAKRGGD